MPRRWLGNAGSGRWLPCPVAWLAGVGFAALGLMASLPGSGAADVRVDCFTGDDAPGKQIESCTKTLEFVENTRIAAHLKRGYAYLEQKQFEKALDDFSVFIGARPDSVLGYLGRGSSHMGQRRFDQAVADFTKVLQLEPKHAAARHLRAAAYAMVGQPDRAIEDLGNVIESNPRLFTAYAARSQLLLERGRKAAAARDFDTGVALGERIFVNYLLSGGIYGMGKSPAYGAGYFSRMMKLARMEGAARFGLGQAYRRMGRTEQAIRQFVDACISDNFASMLVQKALQEKGLMRKSESYPIANCRPRLIEACVRSADCRF